MKKNAILILLCGWVALTSLCFVSCGNDDNPQRINIRELPKEYDASNVSLTVCGIPMLVKESVKIFPIGGYKYEETEMNLRLWMALWPGEQKVYDVHAVSHEDYVDIDGTFRDERKGISGIISGVIKENKINIDVAYELEKDAHTQMLYDIHLFDLKNYTHVDCGIQGPQKLDGKEYSLIGYYMLTLGPVFNRMIECMGANLISAQFNNDFTVSIGTKSVPNGEFKPFPGKYVRVWAGDKTYVCADEEGAKFLSKLLAGSDVIDEDIVTEQFNDRYFFDISILLGARGDVCLKVGGDDWKILNKWYDIFVSEGRAEDASRLKSLMNRVPYVTLLPTK